MYIKNQKLKFAENELKRKFAERERCEDRACKAQEKRDFERAERYEKRIDELHVSIAAQIELLNNLGFMVNVKVSENGYTEKIEISEKI